MKRHAKRMARAIALDEIKSWIVSVLTWMDQNKSPLLVVLVVVALLLLLCSLLVREFELHAARVILYALMGFAAGALGMLAGAYSVRHHREAYREAYTAAKKSLLPLRLRQVVRVIGCSAAVAGLIGAIILTTVSEELVMVWGDHFSWRRLSQMACVSLVVFVIFFARNHMKTRGSGGWGEANKELQNKEWSVLDVKALV